MNILTLDAGGTTFVFSVIKDAKISAKKVEIELTTENKNNLDSCLQIIISGFKKTKEISNEKIDAISFAFPGPADYKLGIIGKLANIPCFNNTNGVALGPLLEDIFNVPVFINNDGDLYAYGEALAGTLPLINQKLKDNNSSKQYKNLIGLTIGTGYGAGIVSDKYLLKGDNICAGEIWITSNRLNSQINAEEAISGRAVKYFFSKKANINFDNCPETKEIYKIAKSQDNPQNIFAQEAFEEMGRFLGDSIANIFALFDGIVVIGGNVSKANEFIIPGIKSELSNNFKKLESSQKNNRVTQEFYCLNNENELNDFLKMQENKIFIPYSNKELNYNSVPRVAYMFSNFNTSEMICIGAYYYAAEQLKILK